MNETKHELRARKYLAAPTIMVFPDVIFKVACWVSKLRCDVTKFIEAHSHYAFSIQLCCVAIQHFCLTLVILYFRFSILWEKGRMTGSESIEPLSVLKQAGIVNLGTFALGNHPRSFG